MASETDSPVRNQPSPGSGHTWRGCRCSPSQRAQAHISRKSASSCGDGLADFLNMDHKRVMVHKGIASMLGIHHQYRFSSSWCAAFQVQSLQERSAPLAEAPKMWLASRVQHFQGLQWMDNRAVGIASNFSLCKSAPVTETAQSLFTYSFLELNVFLFHFYCFNGIVTTNNLKKKGFAWLTIPGLLLQERQDRN